MLEESTLFASNQECGRPSVAQRLIVQQSGWRRTHDRDSAGLRPVGEVAGRTPCQFLRKQRSHTRPYSSRVVGIRLGIEHENSAYARRLGGSDDRAQISRRFD